MEIKSWLEEMREYLETDEELDTKRQEARQAEAAWRESKEAEFREDDLMHGYASLLMEKELKALGNYIIKKYPNKDDKWVIAAAVYYQYGRYCMLANQPAEAIKWYKKAIKNNIPYPYNAWQDLAAAYVETGDYSKADYWIRRYMEHYRSEGNVYTAEWMDFGRFYLKVGWYERALAIMLEARPKKDWAWHEMQEVAKAYFGVRDYEKGYELYETYLEKQPNDEFGFQELAVSYYNYTNNTKRAEELYLKSIELAADRKDARKWNSQIYDFLAIIFANENDWDKSFHYLKLHFQHKFEGHSAEIFAQIIDNRPEIEDNETGLNIYLAVRDFEKSPLRPGGLPTVEGVASSQPSDEVSGASKEGGVDLSDLFNSDESQAN